MSVISDWGPHPLSLCVPWRKELKRPDSEGGDTDVFRIGDEMRRTWDLAVGFATIGVVMGGKAAVQLVDTVCH